MVNYLDFFSSVCVLGTSVSKPKKETIIQLKRQVVKTIVKQTILRCQSDFLFLPSFNRFKN